MRTLWILLLAILLVPLPPLHPGGSAQTASGDLEASGAPWWGPGDPGAPEEGWHFRFPVLIENPHGHPLDDPVALTEVDIGKLLIDAGWNSRSLGATSFPTSFELDPDSFRVIEYTTGFADVASQDPLQDRFYPGRFSVSAEAQYDPARNPVGTLAFRIDGTLDPGETRFYMAYFTSNHQGDRVDDDRPGPLDGWPGDGWGTTVYGHQPTATGGTPVRTDVIARHDGTQITAYEFEGGRPQVADLPDHPNPFTLDAKEAATLTLPSKAFFKLQANQPVLAASRGEHQDSDGTYGGGAFVPGTGTSFTDDRFLLPAYAPELVVSLSELGRATVTGSVTSGSGTVGTLELSSARPSGVLELPVSASTSSVNVVELAVQGVPVTVQYGSPTTGTHLVPSRTGGLSGPDTLTVAPPGSLLRLHPEHPTDLRVLDALQPDRQLFPFGGAETTPAQAVDQAPPATRVAANESFPRSTPVRILSASEDGQAPGILASTGSGDPAGPFYLDDDLTTVTRGPVAVMGAHNSTRVTFTELVGGENVTTTETVNRDGVVLFDPDPGSLEGQAQLASTKPVTILSTTAQDAYARTYPAYGDRPQATVGQLDHRGALVDLDVDGAVGGQSVQTIGPGQTASFDLTATNVGSWLRGAPITEEVTITCQGADARWTVTGCGQSLTLGTGQSGQATIDVQPGDVAPGTRLLLKVSAEGQTWNTTDQAQIALLVREAFGVEAWFFSERGPKDLRDAPFLVDRGDTSTVPLVVENTGTVEDTFELQSSEQGQGWTIETLEDGRPVTTVTLDAGQSVELELEGTANVDPDRLRQDVTLDIVSLSNEQAAARLLGAFEIITELDVSVSTPDPVSLLEPGQNHTFPIQVRNDGEAVVNVALDTATSVPDGWEVHVPVSEVSIFPGNQTELAVQVAIPEDAEAGARGTINLNTEASRNPGDTPTSTRLVLTGLVEHVHDLGVPDEALPVPTGDSVELNVPLVNHGNGEEEIIVLGLTPSWGFTTPGPLLLPVGETGALAFSLDVPPQTPAGLHNLTVHTTLGRAAQENLSLRLDVQETRTLDVDLPDPGPVLPGHPVTLDGRITAAGNVPLNGSLEVLAPDGWTTEASPSNVTLAPGQTTQASFTVTAPSDLEPGPVDLRFGVDPATGETAASDPISLLAGHPDLSLSSPSVEELPDGGLVVQATVANNGTVTARSLELVLDRDGEILADATVERLSPGSETRVSLATETTGDPSGIRLIADPADRLADPDRSDNVLELSTTGIPAPSTLVLLVAVAGLALATRRRWTP